MQPVSRTPADLVIKPRNVMIGRGQRGTRWWKGGDPVATAFYNSLSMVFPVGETLFIDSVRHYRDWVPPEMRPCIDAFIKQEAVHSREHAYFNKQVRDAGYDSTAIEAETTEWRQVWQRNPPHINLAITVGLEHLRAIVSLALLKSDRHFKHESPESTRLWRWHSIEELEHKAVAYDTFLAVTRDLSRIGRWKFRCLVFLVVSRNFLADRVRFLRCLLSQDGLNTHRGWLRVCVYLLIYPGLLRQIFPAWLGFFRPGFHPWRRTVDRALITRTEAQLALRTIGSRSVGADT